jgi:hypothetical protein
MVDMDTTSKDRALEHAETRLNGKPADAATRIKANLRKEILGHPKARTFRQSQSG